MSCAATMVLRTDPTRPLEGGAQRECAAIADLTGHCADRGVGLNQQLRSQVDASFGEIRHGRLADEFGETASQGRAGHPGASSKGVHRPWMCWVAVHVAQGRSNSRIQLAAPRGGPRRVGSDEPFAESGDQKQIQWSIEYEILSRLVLHSLLGEQRYQRELNVGGTVEDQKWRQCVDQVHRRVAQPAELPDQ